MVAWHAPTPAVPPSSASSPNRAHASWDALSRRCARACAVLMRPPPTWTPKMPLSHGLPTPLCQRIHSSAARLAALFDVQIQPASARASCCSRWWCTTHHLPGRPRAGVDNSWPGRPRQILSAKIGSVGYYIVLQACANFCGRTRSFGRGVVHLVGFQN